MKHLKIPGSHEMDNARRRFVVSAGSAIGALVLGSVLPRDARAADLPPLTLAEPTAQILNYTEDASTVDKAKAATYVAGSTCATCAFYQGGAAATGACSLFPANSVNAKGWCTAYAKKA